jgi:hypothetical protein
MLDAIIHRARLQSVRDVAAATAFAAWVFFTVSAFA